MQETANPKSSKACVACHEPIHAKARICRYCGAGQHPRLWDSVGKALKWIGAVTAVISLVLGAFRINDIYSDWYERKTIISELTEAAALQSDANDYKGAWDLIDEALELNPSSRIARQQQTTIAMAWIRDIRTHGEQTFNDIVENLLPTVYTGAVSDNRIIAADAHAHLGWANYLRSQDGITGLEVESFYNHALQLDPDNNYAHAMLGYWLLWSRQQSGDLQTDLTKAMNHFNTALQSNRDKIFVRELQLAALINEENQGLEVRRALLTTAIEIKTQGENLRQSQRRSIFRVMNDLTAPRSPVAQRLQSDLNMLAETIPPQALLELYDWLDTRKDMNPGSILSRAGLEELAGNNTMALSLYKELSVMRGASSMFREYAQEAIIRLSE